MKLLVIEDNQRLADRMYRKLHPFYTIDIVNSGYEALVKLSDVEYDVITLDLGLPDTSGLEVCQKLRELKIMTPVLVVTGVDSTDNIVELLNSGADDYITKPFQGNELRARINALGRRRARHEPKPILTYGDLTINSEQRSVNRGGVVISLRRKEFDILEYLVMNQGRIMTRDMIMNHAWDGVRTSWKGTVDVHIKHLRDKVDKPFETRIIKTAYGLGYRIDNIDTNIKSVLTT